MLIYRFVYVVVCAPSWVAVTGCVVSRLCASIVRHLRLDYLPLEGAWLLRLPDINLLRGCCSPDVCICVPVQPSPESSALVDRRKMLLIDRHATLVLVRQAARFWLPHVDRGLSWFTVLLQRRTVRRWHHGHYPDGALRHAVTA